MNFTIQVSNPQMTNKIISIDADLEENIETLFKMSCEYAFVFWNGISIPLSYKYDISIMIYDIIEMLEETLSKPKGNFQIVWATTGFPCKWVMEWNNNLLQITSHWRKEAGDIGELLNQRNLININLNSFHYEWKGLLVKLIECFKHKGYPKYNFTEVEELLKITDRIDNLGQLYTLGEVSERR